MKSNRSERKIKLPKFFALKWLKITVLILTCISISISFSAAAECRYDINNDIYGEEIGENYTDTGNYKDKLMTLYEELCVTSSCYLNYTITDKKREEYKYLLEYYKEYLDYNRYDYSYDTESKEFDLESDLFYYYAAYEQGFSKKYITNIDISKYKNYNTEKLTEQLKKSYPDYILRYKNDISSDKKEAYGFDEYSSPGQFRHMGFTESYPKNLVPLGRRFEDNYKGFYYYYGNEENIRFLNIDKNDYDNQAIIDGDYEYKENDGDGVSLYTTSLDESPDYKVTEQDDSGITVFIAPNQEGIEKAAALYQESIHNSIIAERLMKIFIFLSVIGIIYLLIACGYQWSVSGGYFSGHKLWGQIPVEIYSAALIVSLLCRFLFMFQMFGSSNPTVNEIYMTIDLSIWNFITAFCILQLIVKFKTKSFIKDCFIYNKIKDSVKKSNTYSKWQKKSFADKIKSRNKIMLINIIIAFVILMFALVAISSGSYAYDSSILILSISTFIDAVVFMTVFIKHFRSSKQLELLCRKIDALSENTEFNEDIDEKSIVYNEYKKLNEISDAVKKSVEEQIKSEKMKIELIANVSHDLKTPLTSVISYIDLLKKAELDDEASSYVQIIDKKADKLKSIVNDVFSLAKATSGIDVNIEKIDLYVLVNQVVADMNDKIQESGKSIKLNNSQSPAFVMADGNKMYRVFQNLIDNALNYSLEGTRIFLDLYKENDEIVFETRNTSAAPIDYTAEEIIMRFVRGDKSRTDGGSGLGLSIAKSFTEACGGKFTLELEGDMFKTFVRMNAFNEEENTENKEI